jgi:hypothetical protein
MNRREFEDLELGDIVYWKAAGMYSADQRRGPLCEVTGKTSNGAVWLSLSGGDDFSLPYQRLQLYDA